jgi:hypothetical protein
LGGPAAADDTWALPPGPASLAGRELPILFLAMGGEAYKDFMLNWAASLRAIEVGARSGNNGTAVPYFFVGTCAHSARPRAPPQAAHVVAVLDDPTLRACQDAGLPYIHVPGIVLNTST